MKRIFFYPVFFFALPILMSHGGGAGSVQVEEVSFPMINSEIRNSMADRKSVV